MRCCSKKVPLAATKTCHTDCNRFQRKCSKELWLCKQCNRFWKWGHCRRRNDMKEYIFFSNFILILKCASLRLLCSTLKLLRQITTFSVYNVIMSRYVRDIGYCFELTHFLHWPKSKQSSYPAGAAGKWRSRTVQTHHCHWVRISESEEKGVRHASCRFYWYSLFAKIWVNSVENTHTTTKRWSCWENPMQQSCVPSFDYSKLTLQLKSWDTDFGSNLHREAFC